MIYLLFCVLIMATCGLINKYAVTSVSPYVVTLANALISAISIPIWYIFCDKQELQSILSQRIFLWIILAASLSTLGFILFLNGLKEKPAYVATSILSTYPAVMMVLSYLLGLNKIEIRQVIGVVLILSGIFFIQSSGH